MSDPHPDRPIAVPKRRLNRSASNNSLGSTGSQGSTSPLAGFSFGNPSTNVTAAKPPLQPNTGFGTVFGSPSIAGFGNTNTNITNSPSTGFQTGFGSALNTPPATSKPTPTIPGFGGFGNTANTPFGGFGNANTANPNSSSIGGFGSANVPTSPSSESANVPTSSSSGSANVPTFSSSGSSGFQIDFGGSNKKRQLDRDDDQDGPSASKKVFAFGTSANKSTLSPFGAAASDSDKLPTFSFDTHKDTTNKSQVSPFGASSDKDGTTTAKPPSFSFGSSIAKEKTDSTTAAKSFTFGASAPYPFSTAPASDKPLTFSSGTSATANKDTTNESQVFTFGASSDKDGTTTAKPPSFSFGSSVAKEKADSTTTAQPFTFDTSTPSPFSAASASDKSLTFSSGTSTTANKDTTNESQVFTFGVSSDKDDTTTAKPPSFSFGSSIAKEKTDSTTATKSFTFGVSLAATTTEKATTEKKNFSFGAPPSSDKAPATSSSEISAWEAATTSKLTISSGAIPTSTASKEFEDGEIAPSTENNADETFLGNKSTPLRKSPLSKSTSFVSSESPFSATKDTATKDKESGKKVTFNLPTPNTIESPASVSLAFSKVDSAEDKTPATLNLFATNKDTVSSERSSVQTTLQSTVFEPSQITYKTRFWELPDEARNELALLAHYITEQIDKHDKIDQEIKSPFGPILEDLNVQTLALDTDAVILRKQLEGQSKSIHELIRKNKKQGLNAISARNVLVQDKKDWRVSGAAENWAFYTSTIESMDNRLKQFTLATDSIEEAITGFQTRASSSPEHIGRIMADQRNMYLSLAGRVADLHQEADRVIKRRKLN